MRLFETRLLGFFEENRNGTSGSGVQPWAGGLRTVVPAARISVVKTWNLWIFLCLALAAARVQEPASTAAEKPVCIVPIRGEIDYTQSAFLRRALAEAKQSGAGLIVFEIDSPGGRIDAMMDMGVQMQAATDGGVRTVAFIRPMEGSGTGGSAYSAAAYLSFCTKSIYMHPGAVIGAATPIMMGPEGVKELPEKFMSATREKFRAVAEQNGYPPNLAVAMVDEDIEVMEVTVNGERKFLTPDEVREAKHRGDAIGEENWVKKKEKILTLTQQQAISYGIARDAKSRAEVYRDLGVSAKSEIVAEFSWSESLVGFLTSGIVQTILMIVGILGIWIELKTPGFGAPGILGIASFAVLLFGHHLVGLAEVTEILVFIAGIAFVAVELFLLPGTGLFAVLGAVCIFAGLVFSMNFGGISVPKESWETAGLFSALGRVMVSFLGATTGFLVLIRFLPQVPFLNRAILRTELSAETGASAPAPFTPDTLVGKTGIAVTPLRPGGKIEIGGVPYDVVTDGDFIEKGEPIRITALEGIRIVVERVKA